MPRNNNERKSGRKKTSRRDHEEAKEGPRRRSLQEYRWTMKRPRREQRDQESDVQANENVKKMAKKVTEATRRSKYDKEGM